ncbi:hypothetical protein Nepgr_025615 [Nepenthes gracilis]|uniref:Transcription factor MYB98 n=1 Tax=Nepenthes gracilis TaxID=150966 RepID=A0AAD3XZN9_NEPGR|nr:hypothetical protein Nepgr_025615 [Nepenthes gracilis]
MEYRETFPSHHQIFFPENYYQKRPGGEEFPIEIHSSSRSFYEDCHHLDQFNTNGSSSNPLFGVHSSCLDLFDCSSAFESLPIFDFYEAKPYQNGATTPSSIEKHFPVIGSGISDNSPVMSAPINMVPPTASRLIMPFNFQEFESFKYQPPDQGSCTTIENGSWPVIGSTSAAVVQRKPGKGRKKKFNVVKGQWTVEEDRLLIELVESHGLRRWSLIAQMLNGRIGKQCRERWHNHLRPDIKKEMWSEEEDRILIEAHAEIGNKWAEIAKQLPGRTENSIKNHWNATKRRQFSRRKCRSKFPRRSSLLQEYIKSLNIETINAGCRKKSSLANVDGLTPENRTDLNKGKSHDDQPSQPRPVSEAYSGNRVLPEYDFSEVPEFNFDTRMFEESSLDSLMDEMHCAPHDLQRKISWIDMPPLDVASIMHCEVKKELDLVEMINQVNI